MLSLVNPGSLTTTSTGAGELVSAGVGVGATGVTVGGGETYGITGSEQALAPSRRARKIARYLNRIIFSTLQD